MKLSNVTKNELINEVIDRYKPYNFALSPVALKNVVESCVKILNNKINLPRYKDYVINKIVTLDDDVDSTLRVYFDTQLHGRNLYIPHSYHADYGSPFYNQDILYQRSYNSLIKRVSGYAQRFKQIENKLYLEDWPADANKVVVVYLPYVNFKENEWHLFPEEREFLENICFAEARIREGKFLRRGSIIEAEMDGDDLISEGKEDKEKAIEEFSEGALFVAGFES